MNERCCRRRERPAWQLLLGSRDFGAIMLLNAMMFMTQNGSRAVLVPLLATQAFGVTTTTLGDFTHTLLIVQRIDVETVLQVARELSPILTWNCRNIMLKSPRHEA